MAGTAPAIMVLKKAIESQEIRGEEAALILQQIPTTVFQPNYVLLEEFAVSLPFLHIVPILFKLCPYYIFIPLYDNI